MLRGLEEGLGFEEGGNKVELAVDSVAQMRYLEIIVNMALSGEELLKWVGDLLSRGLMLYKTEDILLKMAMVQVIAGLGASPATSLLLKEHSIWKMVEKDATVLLCLFRTQTRNFT